VAEDNDKLKDIFSSSKDGIVEIRNGKIHIEDPNGLGRYPRIEAGNHLNLYVEDKLVESDVIVSRNICGKIRWEIAPCSKDKKINIDFTDNKLKAYLNIELVPFRKLRIKDVGPANSIKICTEVIDERYPVITKGEIVDFLHKKDIYYGIKQDKIDEILNYQNSKPIRVLIAEGKEYQEGEDAQIITSNVYKEHREEPFNTIDSITKGEIICYKKELVPGQEGIDVTGEKISPPSVKDIELKAG
jgi:hypothetical protein